MVVAGGLIARRVASASAVEDAALPGRVIRESALDLSIYWRLREQRTVRKREFRNVGPPQPAAEACIQIVAITDDLDPKKGKVIRKVAIGEVAGFSMEGGGVWRPRPSGATVASLCSAPVLYRLRVELCVGGGVGRRVSGTSTG